MVRTYRFVLCLNRTYAYVRALGRGAARAARTRGHACSRRATRVREWYLYAQRAREGVTAQYIHSVTSYVVILLAKYHARRNKFAPDVI